MIRIRHLDTGSVLFSLQGHTKIIKALKFGPTGKFLVSASQDKTIKKWDVTTGKELFSIPAHADNVNDIDISRDAHQSRIVSASWDKTIKVWDAENGKCLTTLTGRK